MGVWRTYGGKRFKEVGFGTFLFQSNSDPNRIYTVDLNEAPYCDCWGMRGSPTLPCCHLLVIQNYMKKLAKVMNETSSQPQPKQQP